MNTETHVCSVDELFVHTHRSPSDMPGLENISSSIARSVAATITEVFGTTCQVEATNTISKSIRVAPQSKTDFIEFKIPVQQSSVQIEIRITKDMWYCINASFFGGAASQAAKAEQFELRGAQSALYHKCYNQMYLNVEAELKGYFGSKSESIEKADVQTRHHIFYEFCVEAESQKHIMSVAIPCSLVNRHWSSIAGLGGTTHTSDIMLCDPMDAEQDITAAIQIKNVEVHRILDVADGKTFVLGDISDVFVTIEYNGLSISAGKLIERSGKYAIEIA